MNSETDNLPAEGGTDNARSLTLEDAANLNWEPEDEANPEGVPQPEEESGEEPGAEPENGTEEEAEGEGEPSEEPEPAAQAEPSDDAPVSVNGKTIPLKDLKAGYMMQADYSRKTLEVANRRRDLDAMTTRVEQSANAMAEFLARQIPEMPDPSLAQTNPGAYVQAKAAHEAALSQVQNIFAQMGQVKTVANTLNAQQQAELVEQGLAKLAEEFPQTSTPEGRKAFFDVAASTARDLGYSDEEISRETDPRMFALAHYAALGLKAEQAKKKALEKVASVPPVTQPKRQKSAAASNAARNRDAMARLRKTGSIDDAMGIDFE